MENHNHQPSGLTSEDKALAAIAYVGPLSLLALFVGKTPFVKFHAKQGLALFLAALVIRIAMSLLTTLFWPGYYAHGYGMMSMMGGGFFMSVVNIIILIAVVAGIVKALSGEEWHMPIIGDLAKKF